MRFTSPHNSSRPNQTHGPAGPAKIAHRFIGGNRLQLLKGNSSKWIHETFPAQWDFVWQEGYGAFSIGVSGIDDTIAYIQNQPEHHRMKTFQEEFITFLKKHGMEYDEATLWD